MDKNRYLIAVDGSEYSIDAVKYASDILPKQNSEIVLFLVGTDIPESFWDIESIPESEIKKEAVEDWISKHNKIFTNTLSKAKKEFTDKGFPENCIHIKTQPRKTGITRDIIAEARNEYKAVFVGRKGLTNTKTISLGSVSGRLVSKLNFTTLVIVGSKPETNNIMIGFDGSAGSENCISLIGQIFENSDKKIFLQHISRSVNLIQGNYSLFFSEEEPAVLEKERIKIANRKIYPKLDKAVEELKKYGFEGSRTESNIDDNYLSRALGLVETASRKKCGTIVLGRKGISMVQDFLIGRVGEKVVHMAVDKAVWIVS